jgi:hypothetical protein
MGHAVIKGERIYIKYIKLEDKDSIKDTLSDWRADGVTETDEEFTLRIKKWVDQNKQMLDDSEDVDTDDFDISKVLNRDLWWTEGIYLKSDDTLVGFTRGKFSGKDYYHYITAIRPSHRGNGYFEEAGAIGNKTLFITHSLVDRIIAMIPIDQLNQANSQSSLDALGVDSERETLTDRIAPITYQRRVITKEQYIEWYNKDEQKSLRDAYYNFEVVN